MTTTTTQEKNMITFPCADDLDTGGWREDSGFRQDLYLDPVDGRVHCHEMIGGISWPEAADARRWVRIWGYDAGIVGASALAILRGLTAELEVLADAYRGTEWDGRRHFGVRAWGEALEELRKRWAARAS